MTSLVPQPQISRAPKPQTGGLTPMPQQQMPVQAPQPQTGGLTPAGSINPPINRPHSAAPAGTGGYSPIPTTPVPVDAGRTGGTSPVPTQPQGTGRITLSNLNFAGLNQFAQPTAPVVGSTPGVPNPGVTSSGRAAWEGGPEIDFSRVDNTGLPGLSTGLDTLSMPELAGGMNTSGFADFDEDFSGASERAARNAYEGATQFMDEDFGAATNAMQTQLINKGLQPGTEAYDREMGLLQRGQNSARTQAAFMAGDVGHQRAGDLLMRALETRRLQGSEAGQDAATRLASRGLLGQEQGQTAAQRLAARGALMGERERDADRTHNQSMGLGGLRLGARGQDTAVAAAQANAGGNAAAANAAAQASRERDQMQMQLALRQLGMSQDGQDFNQFLALLGASRGGVNMPNFGGTSPLDVGGAYGIAGGNLNGLIGREGIDRGTLGSLGASLLGSAALGATTKPMDVPPLPPPPPPPAPGPMPFTNGY